MIVYPKLHQASLEELLIAIIRLKTEDEKYLALLPKDILQQWILDQIPDFNI